MSFAGAQSTTVQYNRGGAGRPQSARAPSTLGAQMNTKNSVIRPAPTARQAVGDRGQALVPIGRHGPIRSAGITTNPMGDHREFKVAFKSTGHATSTSDSCIADFALSKNRPGRFEQLNASAPPEDDMQGKVVYGALGGAQYGKVERPMSARRMPGFADLCREENLNHPPSTLARDRDFDLEDRQHGLQAILRHADKVKLDNVLARTGI